MASHQCGRVNLLRARGSRDGKFNTIATTFENLVTKWKKTSFSFSKNVRM